MTSDCIVWDRYKTKGGYGITRDKGRRIGVHRLADERAFGEIPSGMVVAHKCDNRACFNPDHLFICTQKENLQDMTEKGRRAVGEMVSTGKLGADDVLQIRALYSIGGISMSKVGERFGVTARAVWMIVHRKSWRHI